MSNPHKAMRLRPHNPNHRRCNKYVLFGSSIVIANLNIHVTPLRVPQIYHGLFQDQLPQVSAPPPSQPEPQAGQQVRPYRVIYRHSQPRYSRHPASCTTVSTDLSWAVPRPTPTGQCASALTTRTTGGATSTSLSASIIIANLDIHITPLRVPQTLQVYHGLFQDQLPQGDAPPPSQPEPQAGQQVRLGRVIYRHSSPRHSRSYS